MSVASESNTEKTVKAESTNGNYGLENDKTSSSNSFTVCHDSQSLNLSNLLDILPSNRISRNGSVGEHDKCVHISSRRNSATNDLLTNVLCRNIRLLASESISLASKAHACSGFATLDSSFGQQSSIFIPREVKERLLFEKVIGQCTSLMKVHGSSRFLKTACELFKDDEKLRTRWRQTFEFYKTSRLCDDDERITCELVACLNALVSDEKEVMIGLDSRSSLLDVLITCMRIVTEPDFTLEIVIAIGGTDAPLNLRTPAYAVAGIARLQRLLALREQFTPASDRPLRGTLPTTMFRHAPVLSFFSAWTAAVHVNNLDKTIGEQRARDILSYIKKYMNYYYPSLKQYIRYQLDHANTYEPQLLAHITHLFVSICQDMPLMQDLANQAIRHNSSKEGCVRYAAMHLIMFKDIIDTNNSHLLFHPLNRDEESDELYSSMSLPNCIISIGGAVEKRFGEARHFVRQAFNVLNTLTNNQNVYQCPLSVRMLSRAGQTPVYYPHETHEITVDAVLNGDVTDLNQAGLVTTAVNHDLSILKEDIGMSILKPFWEYIPDLQPSDIVSWKSVVKTWIERCLITWRIHAKRRHRSCQCLIENVSAIDQILAHWSISNSFNDDAHLILQRIVVALEAHNGCPFGHPPPPSIRIICATKETEKTIMNELDHVLSRILITFVRTAFS